MLRQALPAHTVTTEVAEEEAPGEEARTLFHRTAQATAVVVGEEEAALSAENPVWAAKEEAVPSASFCIIRARPSHPVISTPAAEAMAETEVLVETVEMAVLAV
jgi:hypothetical protein